MKELVIAAVTALFGVITFIVGQITVKLFEPAYGLRGHCGAIARDLLVYANRDKSIASDEERLKIFRNLAGTTHEKLYRVVWYPFFEKFLGLPPKDAVEEAASLLLELSNAQVDTSQGPSGPQLWETSQRIRALLRLKIPPIKAPDTTKGTST
jgi:hypothetical protein